MMSEVELKERLIKDLTVLSFPVDEVDFELRPYSKTFYGRYFPKEYKNRKRACVRVYPYRYRNGEFFPYGEILLHAIHEFCHHLQYRNPEYVRRRGIMHDSEFYRLLKEYSKKAVELSLIDSICIERRKVRVV